MKNNRGFSVIELILSFSFVMILALGMFSIVTNYREKQRYASLVKDMTGYRTRITLAIQNDIIDNVLERAEYCSTALGTNTDCVALYFKNGTAKKLEILSANYKDEDDNTYTSKYISYDGIIYETSEPQFTTIKPEFMLEQTVGNGLHTQIPSLTIYKINIPVYHEDLDDNYGLRIIANGYNR